MSSKLKQIIGQPNNIFASGALTFLCRIGGLGLTFLIITIITRSFGSGVYGNYALVFTLAQATALLFALGFPNALVSYLGLRSVNDPFSQHMLRKGIKILVPFTLFPLFIYGIGADLIAEHVFNNTGLSPYITIAAFTVPAMVLHEFVLYFFIATGNFLKFNVFMFVIPNAILLLLLFAITNVPGHYSFLFYFISIVSVLVIECFFAFKKPHISEFEIVPVKAMLKFAFPMMFSGIMLYLLNWTDVFILGVMVSEQELAYYNLAYKVASLSMLVIISVNVVISPKISALFNKGELIEMHKMVRKATYIIIALTIPLVIAIILLSDFLLSFFGNGTEFLVGKEVLIITAIGFLLNAMTGNVDQVLNMTGNQKILQNVTIAGFLLNLVLNLCLIPEFGINGSAIASLLTNIVFNFTCVFYIKRKLGFYTFA